ncbi:MAG TPA: GtrA family protein [Patescibacteria group bacterium]|nr:GtrA family protein [Patescibacteria group bacterium]
MIKKLFLHLWSLRREFVKYFVIGISAFVLDMGTLYLLKQHLGLHPVLAVAVNQPFMLAYVFFFNKHWSFKSKGVTHQQMVRFVMLTGMNYAFAVGWMWIFSHQFGVHYMVARIANIGLAVGWNFLLYKHWVYQHETRDT